MSTIEKNIFYNYTALKTYLTSKGFLFSDSDTKMRWGSSNSQCYWTIDTTTGIINFHKSDNTGNAFRHNLTDWGTGKEWCGCIFITLADSGCALYLTPLPADTGIENLTVCCTNNYHWDSEEEDYVDDSNLLENGLVAVTSAEQDGYWRYTWRDEDNKENHIYWDIDNGQGYTSKGTEIPCANLLPCNNVVTISKAFLQNGRFSNNIYTQVLGELIMPSMIFKINGQKFINFCDNVDYRCPVFRLPAEEQGANISTSTEEYSNLKTYKINDYCIYNNLLYRCIATVSTPEPFDDRKWVVTTVSYEKAHS